MTVRPYNANDYPMVETWWKAHGFEAVNPAFLPVVGFIIEDFGTPRCAAWLKQENSTPIAMMEWLVTNPENTSRESFEAVKEAVGTAGDCARAMGRKALFTYCKQASLAKVYERGGFVRTDENMIHLVMPL